MSHSPARPSSPLEHAVYDPDSRMLKGFLAGLASHLGPGGEGWASARDLQGALLADGSKFTLDVSFFAPRKADSAANAEKGG